MPVDYSELRKLQADLRGAPQRVGTLGGQLVRRTALAVERTAKQRAPVDTGMLRSSIGTTITGSGATITAEIGPTVHYGPYLEFGTRRMPAQPYLGPALNTHADTFVQAVAQLGGEILR